MRTRLLIASIALFAAQLWHGLDSSFRSVPGAVDPADIGEPLGLLALVANIVVIVLIVVGWKYAAAATAVLGAVVAAGFVAYHSLPFDLGPNNPYWGDGTADFIQWLTALSVIGAGIACVWVARQQRQRAGYTGAGTPVTVW